MFSREQLFHACRSFHYDENVEIPDAYVIRMKQVARLLGYEDLQVVEIFKNTVPNRLYWVLFPINNLCEAVETAKGFLTKEKIDRQMTGQSSTPFMKLADKKRKSVTFDARDTLEKTIGEVIDLLVEILTKVIEDMEEVEVLFREAIFAEAIFKVDIIIVWIEVGKIGEHGDNLDQEKEEVGHHLVLDQD